VLFLVFSDCFNNLALAFTAVRFTIVMGMHIFPFFRTRSDSFWPKPDNAKVCSFKEPRVL
jgi:hypothetical protein